MEIFPDHARLNALPLSGTEMTAIRPRFDRAAAIQGFTLLEVLVALVIVGLALGVVFSAELSGLRAAHTASRYEQAVARANTRLAIAVHTTPLVAGTLQGDDGGGFNWRVRVTPVSTIKVQPAYRPASRVADNYDVTLYAVTVWIAWRDGGAGEVRLDTEQIGQAY